MAQDALFFQYQVVARAPLIHESSISAARSMPEITALVQAGALSQRKIASIDDYEAVISELKKRNIDRSAFVEYQQKMLERFHDMDYLVLLKDVELEGKERDDYRDKKKEKFISKLPTGFIQNLLVKKLDYDIHNYSIPFESEFIQEISNAETRLQENKRASPDRILDPVLDERETKTNVPIVLYVSPDVDTDIGKIISSKTKRALLRTKYSWENGSWSDTLRVIRKVLPERCSAEDEVIRREYGNGCYGKPLELSETFLNELKFISF
jgi:hypothetical protein